MDDNVFIVTAEESGERVDALLARHLEGFSRSAVQRLIEDGAVLLDDRPIRKNRVCAAGESFLVTLPELAETALVPQDIPLDVVYEDGDVIVVNKPRGMVVHPAPGHPDGTLVNALLYHCGDSLSGVGGERRPGREEASPCRLHGDPSPFSALSNTAHRTARQGTSRTCRSTCRGSSGSPPSPGR